MKVISAIILKLSFMNFEKSAVRFWYSYFIVLEITKMDGKSEDSVKILTDIDKVCIFFVG